MIEVGSRRIGEGAPCFVAAELGINHNGDLKLAHRAIDAAADAGADGVKVQNYRTEDFISDTSLTYEYTSQGKTVVEPQLEMFKRCELAPEALAELRAHCDERDVVFFSTPSGEQSLRELVESGAPLLKNGSDYLLHLELIRSMARTGLPTVLSTGMANRDEVDLAVEAFRGAGGTELVVLHCTSAYPTPAHEVHLRKLSSLAARYGCPIGLSDHTDGVVASIAAAALGASFIEKHFTLDKTLAGPDHWFSADPSELRALVEGVRFAEAALGTAEVGPSTADVEGRELHRLSCVAARALPTGHSLAEDDLVFRRPGHGFPPYAIDTLVGRTLAAAVEPGHVLVEADLA
ncbi:MAG TPA: N-acetylneuraminate synthase family protein [Gaiellaceae bacterium]